MLKHTANSSDLLNSDNYDSIISAFSEGQTIYDSSFSLMTGAFTS